MARANLNGLLYQGEEEGRVLGVLEVQEEARRIERLWERSTENSGKRKRQRKKDKVYGIRLGT